MLNKLNRCSWCEKDDLYQNYHDKEWGKPILDDDTLFEFLILESFQAGLSWHTILKKRENFRRAFDQFNYCKISKYSEDKVNDLMLDVGIIRHKSKILASINNAQKFLQIQKEYGTFSNYVWGFVDHQPLINHPENIKAVKATTPVSDALSKDLKKKGFKFFGSTTCCAFMQATGMVNDHVEECSFKY